MDVTSSKTPYEPHTCTEAPIGKICGPKSIIIETLQRNKRTPKLNHSKKIIGRVTSSDAISVKFLSEIPLIGKMFGPKSIIFDTLQTCAKNSKIEPFKKILFEE